MGTAKKKRAQVSSVREKWEVIFNALKLLLCKQQSQLDSLLQHRNLLEQRIKILYDRWVFDVRLSEDQVSLMRRQLALAELAKLVEITKADLVNGSKQRESLVYKLKLEHAESELNDFKAWFDILSHRCPDQEVCLIVIFLHQMHQSHNQLFVLTIREMESNYTNQLRTKSDEVDKANEKIMKVIESEPSFSRSRVTRNGGSRGVMASSAELIHERESKLSKRKQSDVVLDETPKLFTSQFKIPKLRHNLLLQDDVCAAIFPDSQEIGCLYRDHIYLFTSFCHSSFRRQI
ncbi:hypothetical protein Cgig2_029093 [Carnegiea gigantea]|uniref:Uncharacterized protein n=1 Tax=Carnegiea gigantea TaxID=171969 RepID=A0A9Q1KBH2_9CARY|nr:hypothetical protein Cgig2_029093 [Carnegiea gigantea]